ncbi:exported hypothetical protein [Nitrospina gracilis 3/211]|uniref:Uncharacterized protein n=1 Tax=Nitrospina gracilis (strain 3/211) TaxID=1266370 RepID=M1Z001_NITG3|nr:MULTISPECIES: CYCXC family (seleno)protein [Nitrospina]MCF8723940.1 hypothetical protein [Nitrospina sp. Nb-3]CCQ91063.1 exported hypothetical protein [Nitrospina gracilis 3/211]
MGKKKSKKNQKPRMSAKSNKKYTLPAVFGAVVGAILFGGYLYLQPAPTPVAPAMGNLIETRPVLTPALFTGKAALAYRYAAEIPKVIDSQFCYCYCKRDHGHKTLLTCFTTMHGSKCGVCIDEVIYAYELYKSGKTLDEIVKAVDDRFYRPYKRHL